MDIDILPLDEIKIRHNNLFGSKATNLGVIARELVTPKGFALSTELYKKVLSQNGSLVRIITMSEKSDKNNLEELSAISEEIQSIILACKFQPQFYAQIKDWYAKFFDEQSLCAVRSSATAEDLPDASFAGQLDTYLNINSFDSTIDAIKRCWASLYTPRAIHYRREKMISEKNIAMSVIIQEMVPATVSGVAFTANPVSNNRSEIYVEAVQGLGESLVSGEKSGDIYLINKENMLVSHGTIQNNEPLLSDYHIKLIGAACNKLEFLYNGQQDIEWSFYKGQVYILQTRPITTLAMEEPITVDINSLTPIAKEVWININERFPKPILPIDGIIAKIYYQSLFSAYKSLNYYVPHVDWDRVEDGLFPEYFMPPAIKRKWNTKLSVKKMKLDIDNDWSDNEKVFNRYIDILNDPLLSTFPMEVVMEYVEEALKDFQRALYVRYLMYIENSNNYNKLVELVKSKYGDKGYDVLNQLIIGEDQITVSLNKELADLAGKAKDINGLCDVIKSSDILDIPNEIVKLPHGDKFIALFDDFMVKYGGREVDQGLGGIGSAIWRDQPEVVWGMVKGMVSAETIADRKIANQVDSDILAKMKSDHKISDLIVGARRYNAFRENSHFYLTEGMSVFSGLFHEMGRRLCQQGYLVDDDDIVYLTYFEIKDILYNLYSQQKVSGLELREVVNGRKERQVEREIKWQAKKDNAVMTDSMDSDNVIHGIPASSGMIKGRVRLIRSPADFHLLEYGDIMLTSYTNPSWTPVFSYIGGLILEYGGVLSHASIIAREYKIPVITGVQGIMSVIHDGDIVILDGSKGEIHKVI